MAQHDLNNLTQPQEKIDILLSWCTANDILIHPDLEIVWNEPLAQNRRPTATATAFPLVDYSDDESDDDGDDEAMWPEEGLETRRGHVSAIDTPIAGVAVIARNSVESGSTVVQIPPYAVLSYPNVFGTPTPTRVGPTSPENARMGKSAQYERHCIAEGPTMTTTTVGDTSSQQKQKREPGSAFDTVNGRSGYGATVDDGPFLIANTAVTVGNIGDEAPAGVASAYSADVIQSLSLSLALLNELVKGETSHWWGYLQSLPTEEPTIAIFWDDVDFGFDGRVDQQERARQEACRHARSRIAGSQLERYLKSPAIQKQKMEIRTFFTRVVLPFLRRHGHLQDMDVLSQWTVFRRAYTLVSSRAFWVDAYHGLALVPIADAFNHSEEHDVHLETDWEVCRVCGALEACGHDEEDGEIVKSDPISHSFDMVSDRPVNQGQEVFNTYNVEQGGGGVVGVGGIGNVELLCRYGFVLEGNGADLIVFEKEELEAIGGGGTCDGDNSNSSQLLIDAGLVKDPPGVHPGVETGSEHEMDAEGRISLALWTRLGKPANNKAKVCSGVVRLCEGRLREMDGDDDECSGQRVLTVVGRYVRGERALLEAAVELWKEVCAQ